MIFIQDHLHPNLMELVKIVKYSGLAVAWLSQVLAADPFYPPICANSREFIDHLRYFAANLIACGACQATSL
jgi:hypothetical protein